MQWPDYVTQQPPPAVFHQSGWMDCRHGYTYGQGYDVGYYEYTYQLQCRQYCHQPVGFESVSTSDWGPWEEFYRQGYCYEEMSYCPAVGYSQVKKKKIRVSVLRLLSCMDSCPEIFSLLYARKNLLLLHSVLSAILYSLI